MRKLLFVHEERYLELAIRNVQDLFGFEQRLAEGSRMSDLLAVLLMSFQVVNDLLSVGQTCDLQRFSEHDALFAPNSLSLNQCWTLVTLSRIDFQEPRSRDEALDRILDIIRTRGFVVAPVTVFRTPTSEGPHPLTCE